jgi:hypothetical protein
MTATYNEGHKVFGINLCCNFSHLAVSQFSYVCGERCGSLPNLNATSCLVITISLLSPPHRMWWTYCFRSNSVFLWISTKISIGRRFWSNNPMDWLPSLLIMLIIQFRSETMNFRDFKDFDDFVAVFHQIFTGSRYLSFTKSGALTVILTSHMHWMRWNTWIPDSYRALLGCFSA